MTSPDLRNYTDLTIYDRDAQDVYEMAVSIVQAAMPEWKPQEGNTEVLLIEAMAQEVMETIYAINRLPGAVMQTLLQLYGVTRAEGIQPKVTIRVTMSDNFGHDVPIGTRFLLNIGEGIEPVIFATDVGVVTNPGQTTVDVLATGDRFTSDANGIEAGQYVELLDAIPYVDFAVTQTDVTGGVPEETDQSWLDRGVARLSRLVDTLTIPSHFTAAAMEYQFVTRATTLDNYDPSGDVGGDGPVGNDAGHVTVAVYGDGDVVSPSNKTIMDNEMEAKALANLEIHIIDPTINVVNVSAEIVPAYGYSGAAAVAAAQSELLKSLSPSEWDWSSTLYLNDIVAIISRSPAVARVTDVTTPSSDLTLNGVAPLVVAGTLNITVA